MIKTEISDFDGNSWEKYCQSCLKLKYEEEGYQELPAWNGDMGIEGFTRSGKVFQCYCPDEDYDPTVTYEKQRDKITNDLRKLETNIVELKSYLGDIQIKEWIFLSPIIKNKNLIRHCHTKALEYRRMGLDILSEDFDVLAYDADFFVAQTPIVLRFQSNKVEISPNETNDQTNWRSENISMVNNAISKHGKLLPDSPNKENRVNKLTEMTIDNYLSEMCILQKFMKIDLSEYERFLRIVADFEGTVEERCMLNTEKNLQLYENIKRELKSKLAENFTYLEDITLEKLMKGVVADWILRCPINFE